MPVHFNVLVEYDNCFIMHVFYVSSQLYYSVYACMVNSLGWLLV